MEYQEIVAAKFVDRPNRFIAHVDLQGKQETVHVKNTGRCGELLVKGATVYLEKGQNPERKTAYDLVAVEKNGRMINMDSQAPNKVVEEWIRESNFFPNVTYLHPEYTYGESRIDFYLECENRKIFIEVKGVTLEKENVVSFPDAPSDRAIKHLHELSGAVENGYEAYVFFVIQMEKVRFFMPEKDRHPEFAKALREAREKGVKLLAYDCLVTPNSLKLRQPVPVFLDLEAQEKHLQRAADRLLPWFALNKRELPWRSDPTPYHVWLSEIMLQQTRVEAVKPYYARFLEKLPDIESLASAPEESLLKLWEGLGYYSRVRNLQAAAQDLMENYDGKMPREYEQLLKLKGIGEYTAGAISSIAYGQKAAAVDGNVLRVFARYRMDSAMITDSATKKRVFQELCEVLPEEKPGDFNQAVMDLGATVCIPNGAPHCMNCPLREDCCAHLQNCEEQYPKKEAKKGRTIEEMTVLVIVDEGKVALHKRGPKGLLAGMYEFPNVRGHLDAKEVEAYLKECNVEPLRIQRIADYVHIFTHKEWHMIAYLIHVDELSALQADQEAAEWEYVNKKDTGEGYPIPSAFSTYRTYII